MNQTKKILLAFLSPFALAVGVFFLAEYVLPDDCTIKAEVRDQIVCLEYHNETWIETFYALLFYGLIFLSIILPVFITGREYQSRKAELKAKSIFR